MLVIETIQAKYNSCQFCDKYCSNHASNIIFNPYNCKAIQEAGIIEKEVKTFKETKSLRNKQLSQKHEIVAENL